MSEKRNSYFQFKQFRIEQENCAMKVNTDGTLLGAWCHVEGAKKILDIGTGTGVVALMCLQRAGKEAKAIALEIDEAAALQAQKNAEESPWKEHIRIIHQSMQEYDPISPETFDMITCNPPYFKNSLKSRNEQRDLARHSESLSITEIAQFAGRHLSENGTLNVVLPKETEREMEEEALKEGLFTNRVCNIITKKGNDAKRILLEMSKTEQALKEETITLLAGESNEYTQEFKTLMQAYLLHL